MMNAKLQVQSAQDEPAATVDRMRRGTLSLFALTNGLSVADIYYAQPSPASIARDFAVTPAFSGMVVSVTQFGYVMG